MVRWDVALLDQAAADETGPDRRTVGAIVGALGGMLAVVVLTLAQPLIVGAVYLILALLGLLTH
jgi:hypothetical protein